MLTVLLAPIDSLGEDIEIVDRGEGGLTATERAGGMKQLNEFQPRHPPIMIERKLTFGRLS